MIAKNIIKKAIYPILGNSFSVQKRINKIRDHNLLTILNLHKVGFDDGSSYPALNPEIFEQLLNFLLENYQITSFSELINERENNQNISGKPKVILSFDDGYKDFVNVIHPILQKFGIRANQNIIPGCIENNRPPLNVLLQDFIGKNKTEIYTKIKIPSYEWNRSLSKEEEGTKLSTFIKNNSFNKQLEFYKEIYNQAGDDLYENSTEMMNLDDVKNILDKYDWGAHSYSHANMGYETDSYFLNDLKLCRKWFNQNLGIQPYIYAFPNGSYKDYQLSIAQSEGFSTLLLVEDNFSSSKNSIHPRLGFHADSKSEMRFKSVGSFRKFKSSSD